MFSTEFKGGGVGLHYTAFRDAIREDSQQTTPSRGVSPRKKFAVEANVESRVKGMSTPEEQHANQNYRGGNCIPDKVHPMDALTATKTGVFVIAIKTIPSFFHLTNQPRQKSKLALSA